MAAGSWLVLFQVPIKFYKIKWMNLLVTFPNNTDLFIWYIIWILVTSGEEGKKGGFGFSSWSDVAGWCDQHLQAYQESNVFT